MLYDIIYILYIYIYVVCDTIYNTHTHIYIYIYTQYMHVILFHAFLLFLSERVTEEVSIAR